ncbi:cytochrome b5-like Heme/Steroid binding domain protein [Ancylostoma ceylanicum]|uniref:sulfite oxidase n=1 Tax=Ancylostoma ceylanicum TaxID=53326 RepID=A0A0D6M0X3_9BILA|nr:cytochrome b5-like Heme/Steroid binding domain protein [Ancylostoma ceylanicum]
MVIAASCGLGLLAADPFRIRTVYAEAHLTEKDLTPPVRRDLPVFKKEEVKKHGKGADRGVYDVTDFVEAHPGGDKVLLAAGGPIEPYWALYAQHETKEVMGILEELRIGSLDPSEVEEVKKSSASDPYSTDPDRHPALLVNQQRPFNAETPPSLAVDSFRTPNDLFFVRNHMPVPKIDAEKHRLHVEGLGVKGPLNLSVKDLKKNHRPVSVTAAIQCSGNRRADMNK